MGLLILAQISGYRDAIVPLKSYPDTKQTQMSPIQSPRSYNWSESQAVGEEGLALTIEFLNSLREPNDWATTISLIDLSDNLELQRKGIDLLWCVDGAFGTCVIPVEVKADRYWSTGNFFFETVSDTAKGSPGAFLATTSELYFYVFPDFEVIYSIPVDEARIWFLKNQSSFIEKTVRSQRRNRSWETKGVLVPINVLLKNVDNVRCFLKVGDQWQSSPSAQNP